MAIKTTYTDPSGKKREGYIQNGVAYANAALTEKVPEGSVVNTQGGTYYKGSAVPYGVEINTPNPGDDTFSLYGKDYKTHYDNVGSAYVDKGLTTRVPDGSTLYKDGVQYVSHGTLGTLPTMGGAIEKNNKNLSSTEELIKSAYSAQEKAAESRTAERVKALKKRERQVAEEKREADRLSYNAYLQAINPYGAVAEQMARLGLSNSGYSETAMLSLSNTYQQALAGNEQARAEAMRELVALADSAREEGNREKYELYAAMYQKIAEARVKSAESEAELSLKAAEMLAEDSAQREKDRREDEKLSLEAEQAAAENTYEALSLVVKSILSGELTLTQAAKKLNISTNRLKELLSELY